MPISATVHLLSSKIHCGVPYQYVPSTILKPRESDLCSSEINNSSSPCYRQRRLWRDIALRFWIVDGVCYNTGFPAFCYTRTSEVHKRRGYGLWIDEFIGCHTSLCFPTACPAGPPGLCISSIVEDHYKMAASKTFTTAALRC